MALPFFILIKNFFIRLIREYQTKISPILSHRCRFQKTCSQHSIESIHKFGIIKGGKIALIRILQCHPLNLNKNEYFAFLSHLNIQGLINMTLQRNLFIIIFLLLSFILWQTWQIDNQFNNNNTEKNLENHHSEPYVISKNINEYSHLDKENKNCIITVKTDVLILKINTHEGNIEKAYLVKYSEDLQSNKPLCLINNSAEFIYKINSELINKHPLNHSYNEKKILYTTATADISDENILILPKNSNILQLSLMYRENNGIEYTKIYTFYRGDYSIHINYIINNMSKLPIKIKHIGTITQSINYPKLYHNNEENSFPIYSYRGAAYSTHKEKYQKYNFSDIKKTNLNIHTSKGWIAMLQKYFVTAWLPINPINNIFYTNYSKKNNTATVGFKSDTICISPNEKINTLQSMLWIGPKIQEKMKKTAPNLNLVIDYGWFWFISQPLFKLLHFIYNYVGNWGISIIIITLIIRMIMYPLTKAQYTSMAKIRMLQPKISLIQEKYKHDKYQYHQKTIELYKSEKVNPLGGCLPLLIQMPIFLALYYMLSSSVELRHAQFAFWIHDLSSKDPCYILPTLMGISMFYIQKMSPTTISDPMQKKVMNVMLIIFTIFFLWFPSGLVLYYVISNIITIIQQQIIHYELKKKGLHNP